MRPSRLVTLTAFGVMTSLACVTPALAGWSAAPVEVQPSNVHVPHVALAPDGQGGTVVVWQEQTATGGQLRARHLMVTGDLDPAWPAPVVVSTRDITRSALGAVTDGAGGAFVWWTEGKQLLLTRVTASGAIASGWAATGKALGSFWRPGHRPIVKPDGTGGVYVAWIATSLLSTSVTGTLRVARIMGTGAAVTGWPAGGRSFGPVGLEDPTVVSGGLDVAADGSAWLAWVTADKDSDLVARPGEVRALRLQSNGLPALGWGPGGVVSGPFDATVLNAVNGSGYLPTMQHLVAVASDGGTGAYVLAGMSTVDWYSGGLEAKFLHLDGVGGLVAPFTTPVSMDIIRTGPTVGAEASLQLIADRRGGAYLCIPAEFSDSEPTMRIACVPAGSATIPWGWFKNQYGLEMEPRGDGGLLVANLKPSGSIGAWDTNAFVSVSNLPAGGGYSESQRSYYSTRYGDVSVAATGDGGAIFAWSQELDRHGVYALRIGLAGAVTDVTPPALSRPTLSARFDRARGVVARLAVPGGGSADLALLDLQGRAFSVLRLGSGSEGAFPGSRDLVPGVYFVRALAGKARFSARVVVVR